MTTEMSAAEFLATAAKPSKYGNVKTVIDGIEFDSKKEAHRYVELSLMLHAGEITELVLQPRYDIEINGEKVCAYVADFAYWDVRYKKHVVEDAKGMRTQTYNLKKKLVKAVYGIDVKEV